MPKKKHSWVKKLRKNNPLVFIFIPIAIVSAIGAAAFATVSFISSNTHQPTHNLSPRGGAVGTLKAGSTQSNQENATKNNPVTPFANSSPRKGYAGSVCTKTVVPNKTVYQDASWLYDGDTKVGTEGWNGWVDHCTPDSSGNTLSDISNPPVDKVILVGTRPYPSSSPSPARTYQQAYTYCATHGVPGSSSAWDQCINAFLGQSN